MTFLCLFNQDLSVLDFYIGHIAIIPVMRLEIKNLNSISTVVTSSLGQILY